jgi:hypothetical protein
MDRTETMLNAPTPAVAGVGYWGEGMTSPGDED